jgi:starvation-inducible DNA-binding protein
MKTNIGIEECHTEEISKGLNILLSEEYALYITTRHFHWNVEGPLFYMLHKMYEQQYEQIEEILDSLAERIRAIGEYADVEIKNIPALKIKDYKLQLEELLSQHEKIIRFCRKVTTQLSGECKDAGTNDFVGSIMIQHEKTAWILRAHLS